ncbi:MAG: baseplate J/gp47 family protein [Candidatus Marinimicrobia bacterium]|nr:baseplate J/gp47 family protein [Candidatus Neomarinimicrobiota bacterium]
MHDLELQLKHNEINLYGWGEEYCILPEGSVTVTLEDDLNGKLDQLQVGDLLLFEELVPGPGGGEPDPSHRHVVRIIHLKRTVDPLITVDGSDQPTPVVTVSWAPEDALPFPLSIGENEFSHLSVARGNIVLADQGATLSSERLEPHVVPSRGNYRPRIYRDDITYSQPYDHSKASAEPAAGAITQDTRKSLPGITLQETESGSQWYPRRDLLGSYRFAHEFVLESGGNKQTQLRFGDNIVGKRPAAGLEFNVTCRIGNGKAGNVGAGVLSMLNLKGTDLLADDVSITNPLPASGGTERENMDQTRLFASHRFRIPERAVTADDYARMAQRHPNVQNAAGILRWTGSWNTVYVLVDRSGGLQVDKNFKAEMGAFLERYRLAGHVLEIRGPQFVFLDIALEVHAKPGHLRSDLKRDLLDISVGRGDQESGKKAIFHPDNFTFGQNVYLSQVVSAAAKIPGVESILPIRFQRWGLPYKGEMEAAVVQIDPLEVARLDNDPNAPEKGRIEFIMRGGM